MTTVLVYVAQGYRGAVQRIKESNASLTDAQAVAKWAERKYGVWITDNLTQEFTIENPTGESFELAFTDPNEARAFVSRVGGRIQHG